MGNIEAVSPIVGRFRWNRSGYARTLAPHPPQPLPLPRCGRGRGYSVFTFPSPTAWERGLGVRAFRSGEGPVRLLAAFFLNGIQHLLTVLRVLQGVFDTGAV